MIKVSSCGLDRHDPEGRCSIAPSACFHLTEKVIANLRRFSYSIFKALFAFRRKWIAGDECGDGLAKTHQLRPMVLTKSIDFSDSSIRWNRQQLCDCAYPA